MKKIIISFVVLLSACSHQTLNTEQYLAESRTTAQKFSEQLGGTLKQQIQTGGVESAIPVCKQIAPALAAQHSTDKKIVKRVSNKNRNAIHGIPDAWEKTTLERFQVAINANQENQNLEFYEMVTESNHRYFRYANGIRVQSLCLKCHGQEQDISPNVKKLLNEHYPDDQATGYKVGDLRGAISIKTRLD
jgi:hypothetical protein